MYWTDLYFKIKVISEIIGSCLITGLVLFGICMHLKDEGWLSRRKQ